MHWGSQDTSLPGHQSQFPSAGGYSSQLMQNSDGIPLDSSNFPALSTQNSSANMSSNSRLPAGTSSGAIGQQLSSSQMQNQLGRSPQFGGEFVAQKEDFPALSSIAPNPGSLKSGIALDSQVDYNNFNEDTSRLMGSLDNNDNGVDLVNKNVRYGLLGLLEAIRMTNKDLNLLSLGNDLTTFGLNLNSNECLYVNFSSEFPSDGAASSGNAAPVDSTSTPAYHTPTCYITPPPVLKHEQFIKLQLETLFYIFYVLPKDMLQALAAQELYRRDWKYHGEFKIWIKARSSQEQSQSHPGVYFIYFDLNSWDIRPFNPPASKQINTSSASAVSQFLSAGLLAEEDIVC